MGDCSVAGAEKYTPNAGQGRWLRRRRTGREAIFLRALRGVITIAPSVAAMLTDPARHRRPHRREAIRSGRARREVDFRPPALPAQPRAHSHSPGEDGSCFEGASLPW